MTNEEKEQQEWEEFWGKFFREQERIARAAITSLEPIEVKIPIKEGERWIRHEAVIEFANGLVTVYDSGGIITQYKLVMTKQYEIPWH